MVRGKLIRTTILDKYSNVKIDPYPFCVQGKEQFFKVICNSDRAEHNFLLKSIEHSTNPEEFNSEFTFLLDGKEYNEKLSKSSSIARIINLRLSKESGTGRTYSETLIEGCGQNLLEYKEQKVVSVIEWSEIAHKVVEAIEYAHKDKVFHGDIRPEKIFINSAKNVKVIDFGGSFFLSAGRNGVTERVLLERKITYWPPEKFEVLDLDISNEKRKELLLSFDIYSWGMTFYQLISNKTVKDIERENILYKQNEKNYSGFIRVLDEIASLYNKESTYMVYFDLLFRKSLEFNTTKRIQAEELCNISRGRYGLKFKSEATKIEERKSLLKKKEERHKNLCYCCMTEFNTVIKGLIGCDHKVCTGCIHKAISNTINESETSLQFACCLCKLTSKIKEIILQCGCPCDIEAIRNVNKSKSLTFSKDNKKLCTAFCTNSHELTEIETFLIFANSKLSFCNANINKELTQVISNSLSNLQLIKVIDLGQNQIDSRSLELLIEPMCSKKMLMNLYLDRNPLGPEAGKALAKLLENSNSLTNLVLGIMFLYSRYVSAWI